MLTDLEFMEELLWVVDDAQGTLDREVEVDKKIMEEEKHLEWIARRRGSGLARRRVKRLGRKRKIWTRTRTPAGLPD
jgi:hypothetical protein